MFVDKVLPTLGNEKEQQQIKSYKKIWGELIFSRATKNLTNNLFQLPDWATAQKLRLHYIVTHYCIIYTLLLLLYIAFS